MSYFRTTSARSCLRLAARHLFFGLFLGSLMLVASQLDAKDIAHRDKPAKDERAVQLKAFDGSAVIEGQLIEVSHGSYVIKTPLGLLRIAIEDADCIGVACPTLDRFDRDFSILDATGNFKSMVPALLEGYADYIGADSQVVEMSNGTRQISIIDHRRGIRLASIDHQPSEVASSLALIEDGPESAAAGMRTNTDEMRLFIEDVADSHDEQDDNILVSLDGIALIVHPDNPVQGLELATIADLFACERRDWQDLGGPGGQVQLFVRDEGSDVYESFRALMLERFDIELCENVEYVSSDADMVSRIAEERYGLGFINLGSEYRVKPLAIRACGMDYQPTIFNAKVGEYPLVRRVLVQTPPLGQSSAAAQSFVDFTLSNPGQRWLEERGLVGLGVGTTRDDSDGYRATKMDTASRNKTREANIHRLMKATGDAFRLSTTFRFAFSASNLGEENALDDRSSRDLSRLASYLTSRAKKDLEVLVFGFADSVGNYDANLVLSQERAQSIADKLAFLGVSVTEATGFGEEAPVACNTQPKGRAMNRRVEIWLRS